MNKIRHTLLSMAYQESRPKIWAKPVGFHFFTFEESTGVWTNWFSSVDDKIMIFESHTKTSDEDFLCDLKTWEAYARISTDYSARADFRLRIFE